MRSTDFRFIPNSLLKVLKKSPSALNFPVIKMIICRSKIKSTNKIIFFLEICIDTFLPENQFITKTRKSNKIGSTDCFGFAPKNKLRIKLSKK